MLKKQKEEIIVHIQDNKKSNSALYQIIATITGGAIVFVSNYIAMNTTYELENKKIIAEKEKLIYEINHQKKIDVFTEFSYAIDNSFKVFNENTPDKVYGELMTKFFQLLLEKKYEEANNIFYEIQKISTQYSFNLEEANLTLTKTSEMLHKYKYNLLPYISNKDDRIAFEKKYNQLTSYFQKNINNVNLIINDINTLLSTYKPDNPNSIYEYSRYIEIHKEKTYNAYLAVTTDLESDIKNLNEIKTFTYNILFK
ncbi:hypothetical protein [Sulfurimonas microaerophilic]|uniref:hypothetical protein n=1 Tax=Sulfurimonas microaerophilic TaxID=3058392 RepID=UPI002714C7FC|nr:hypothetical protein [Sulfurimonas sp. hsl 1-7]